MKEEKKERKPTKKPRRVLRRNHNPYDKVRHHVLYLRESEIERWPQERIMKFIDMVENTRVGIVEDELARWDELRIIALVKAVDKIRTNYSTFDSLLKDINLVRELREKGISDKERRKDGSQPNP